MGRRDRSSLGILFRKWTCQLHDRYLLCRYDKYGLRTVTPKTTSLRSARWLCTLWVVVPVNVPLGPDTQRVSLVNLLLLRQAVGDPTDLTVRQVRHRLSEDLPESSRTAGDIRSIGFGRDTLPAYTHGLRESVTGTETESPSVSSVLVGTIGSNRYNHADDRRCESGGLPSGLNPV